MCLTKFCCCCDLRRGCIVFAWLQTMGITMTIATLIGYSDMMNFLTVNSDHSNIFTPDSVLYMTSVITYVLKIYITGLFIKAVTCISLTWGIVKKCHLFYQPWLFISFIEVCVSSLAVLIFFILGSTLRPEFFLLFFLCGGLTALNWYFWACVYTVYQRDMKQLSIMFELYENSDEPTLL